MKRPDAQDLGVIVFLACLPIVGFPLAGLVLLWKVCRKGVVIMRGRRR